MSLSARRSAAVPRVVALAAVAVLAAVGLAACQPTSELTRPSTPVVVTGARLGPLLGAPVGRVVAFRWDGDARRWRQVPVQVDQRTVVAFGLHPRKSSEPATTGIVYGGGEIGPTALQYADAGTWVGADPDPTLDRDDEVAMMAADAGGWAPADSGRPPGTADQAGVAIEARDPRSGELGWLYLWRSTGGLDPGAGQDYVDYDFVLTSGPYKTTYLRADGPNPETSRVRTAAYEIDFTDRWKETAWRVRAPGATGVDLIDAQKNQFATSTCGRSNQTFSDAEGAFVANIDGPVRAIRSYVGANSGPLTQRTHLMYRDRVDVVTDLRVHNIPGIMDYVDYSSAAVGMTYRSSTLPAGVTIDGIDDVVPTAPARWEALDGPQGRIYTRVVATTSQPGVAAATRHFYEDQQAPVEEQCFGEDAAWLGASGLHVQTRIENTDPRSTPFVTFRGVRTTQYLPPAGDPSKIPAYADDWARDLEQPLQLTTTKIER